MAAEATVASLAALTVWIAATAVSFAAITVVTAAVTVSLDALADAEAVSAASFAASSAAAALDAVVSKPSITDFTPVTTGITASAESLAVTACST
ncbi:hypothetical protein D9M71_732270 [compost metagenome]